MDRKNNIFQIDNDLLSLFLNKDSDRDFESNIYDDIGDPGDQHFGV
jgi:hypothetical protein